MIRMTSIRRAVIAALVPFISPAPAREAPGREPHSGNPVLPGYFADPSIVTYKGQTFIYATIDPWGGDTLGCWESGDFKNWTYRTLNWPTKKACTSPTSAPAMVWAPSVVRTHDGRFFMYVSVGSEVWVGTADNPLGPWSDANGGHPLIPGNYKPGFHMIDAEAFIDNDGQAYLYWGSGWNWTNGRCWAVKLKPDMVTFDGEVRDVTPASYFEGPFMFRHGSRYYLMYSSGMTIGKTYQVHYAIGSSPLGPFTEAPNSPALASHPELNVLSPGHHAVFEKDGRAYILYHRHSIPFDPSFIGRQVCIDELNFTEDGLIAKVEPTHDGPPFIRNRMNTPAGPGAAVKASASSQRNPDTGAEHAIDDNYATLWAAAAGEKESWIALDFGSETSYTTQRIRFEYAWKAQHFTIECSNDGREWRMLEDHLKTPATGSPVTINAKATSRYLRMTFPGTGRECEPAVFEWTVE